MADELRFVGGNLTAPGVISDLEPFLDEGNGDFESDVERFVDDRMTPTRTPEDQGEGGHASHEADKRRKTFREKGHGKSKKEGGEKLSDTGLVVIRIRLGFRVQVETQEKSFTNAANSFDGSG